MLGGIDPEFRCGLVDDSEKERNLKMLEVPNCVVCLDLIGAAFHLDREGGPRLDHWWSRFHMSKIVQ
jgi:hypothetical protein